MPITCEMLEFRDLTLIHKLSLSGSLALKICSMHKWFEM